jgi:hypothetical protein
MAFPYRLYGGAARSDAISGLNPAFASALTDLFNAAPPEVQAQLGLASAYRSVARQQELWNASDKSGRWVAAPGKSRHNFGEAADLYGFGLKNAGNVSQATRDYVHQNAGNYGLAFPMSYEPWHIQLARSQGQSGPGASRAGDARQSDSLSIFPTLPYGRKYRHGQWPRSSSPEGELQPPPIEMAPASNPVMNAIMGPQQDWMNNTSYSGDAIVGDFFAGRNPLRRFAYQKIMGLFS